MTSEELYERQSWSLQQKIDHSLGVIEHFVNTLGGLDKVYVSFSGGKDSTVLLHLAKRLYPNIKAMFINTGNEYPDIVKFVREMKKTNDIDEIHPRRTMKEIFEKLGFPLVSKEYSMYIRTVRNSPDCKTAKRIMDDSDFKKLGILPKKWRFLTEVPFNTTPECCKIIKKRPAGRYERKTGRSPIIGTMADESRLRQTEYIKRGQCNVFGERSTSTPLAVWTEKDINDYIERFNVPIAKVYDYGVKQTGCVACGFGIGQKNGYLKFEFLKEHYPKYYDMIMNYENNGVKFKDALELCRR
jgi:3'-phosphoadenosine 5'-phosphosulfate sulfotransferase (PAPS reductase)/FAD synthetase